MDRGARQGTVPGVAKSQTALSDSHFHCFHSHLGYHRALHRVLWYTVGPHELYLGSVVHGGHLRRRYG